MARYQSDSNSVSHPIKPAVNSLQRRTIVCWACALVAAFAATVASRFDWWIAVYLLLALSAVAVVIFVVLVFRHASVFRCEKCHAKLDSRQVAAGEAAAYCLQCNIQWNTPKSRSQLVESSYNCSE